MALKMDQTASHTRLGRCNGRGGGRTDSGFTLVEVITVLVIISILAVFAAPEVINWRPKMRLKSAADTLAENLQRAKMHAIKNNVRVVFTFTTGAGTPCQGGSYLITESPTVANIVVPLEIMANNLCLEPLLNTTFVAGDGFTSRGLPINGIERIVTISNADLYDPAETIKTDPIYIITQSVAGGLQLEKDIRKNLK